MHIAQNQLISEDLFNNCAEGLVTIGQNISGQLQILAIFRSFYWTHVRPKLIYIDHMKPFMNTLSIDQFNRCGRPKRLVTK